MALPIYNKIIGDSTIKRGLSPILFFNSNHRENTFESRSDDKGPEPEGVTIAKLWGQTYAFIGLERIGGVMIYDISNPYESNFVQYLNNRDFSAAPGTPEAKDLGAEGLMVIEAGKSPILGVPLLVVANEVSGTTTIFKISRKFPGGKKFESIWPLSQVKAFKFEMQKFK